MRKGTDLIFRGTTKNFSESEFRCKCGCGAYNMREPFIARLQYARTQAGIPFIIELASVCPKRVTELTYGEGIPARAEALAAYMEGRAALISADPDRLAEYGTVVTAEEIFGLIVPALLKAEFKSIGIFFDQKLIHVDDVGWYKNRPVIIWGE